MTKSDGGSAFPREDYQTDTRRGQPGMTMRQAYKIAALSMMKLPDDGEYSKSNHNDGRPQYEARWRASAASRMADEMIAEDLAFALREKTK